VFRAGEPGKPLPYFLIRMDVCCFHRVPGTEGPKQHLHFPDSTPRGAFTGLSSQLGLRLPGRYPKSPTRSSDRSGTLVPSSRGLPHGRQLRSHPVWHRLCGFPASPERGLAPLFHVVRNIQAFPPGVRFVFAPVRQDRPGYHGIKQRDYPGMARFSPLPPPRTVQAPLRAYGATQLAPWRGASGTAGVK